MKTINLELKTVTVKSEIRQLRTNATWEIGEPIFDCCDDECAKFHGFVDREDYRRKMNSEEGYECLLEMMGEI